ncbi:MAG: glycogen synthase GlgA [Lachnospiraceae bacterium]|nr:glycogen synthase GlgA [Lachnospiraceae bacterium]
MIKVLFAASEAVPFIKTGGLADVIGSMPKYFDKEEVEVRVILPKYLCIKEIFRENLEYRAHFYMDLNWRTQYVGILETNYQGIHFYFIDNEFYFSGPTPYGNIYEDIEKFAFYGKAVLCAIPHLDFKPDIIHCHDWQSGLVPVFLDHFRFDNDYYRGIKTMMTIHNLKFQGRWDTKKVQDITGLAPYYFVPDKLEAYKDANYLKGGIVYADWVTTVSHTYAQEIKMPFYGEGLHGLMSAKSNHLSGILNGIDYEEYNPETDKFIAKQFGIQNFRQNKSADKISLQKELGLTVDKQTMMIGIVSRLTDQKGFDLISCVFDEMCQDAVQFVILGTGEERYENMFRHFAWKYPEKVSANIFYSEELSHKIYGSVDAFLMPSLFEPCGLSQLMSLRYGTVPIVRQTGGLKDTVEPYNEFKHTGTGFGFNNYNAHEMMGTVRNAERIYYDKKRDWNKLAENGMKQDFSWTRSAKEYQELYTKLVRGEV